MEKNKVPYISRGSYLGLLNALSTGVYVNLDRIVLHTITSGGEHVGDLCIVFPEDKSIHWIDNSDLRNIVDNLSGEVTTVAEEVTTVNNKVDSLGTLEIDGQPATISQYVGNSLQNNSQFAWEEF